MPELARPVTRRRARPALDQFRSAAGGILPLSAVARRAFIRLSTKLPHAGVLILLEVAPHIPRALGQLAQTCIDSLFRTVFLHLFVAPLDRRLESKEPQHLSSHYRVDGGILQP